MYNINCEEPCHCVHLAFVLTVNFPLYGKWFGTVVEHLAQSVLGDWCCQEVVPYLRIQTGYTIIKWLHYYPIYPILHSDLLLNLQNDSNCSTNMILPCPVITIWSLLVCQPLRLFTLIWSLLVCQPLAPFTLIWSRLVCQPLEPFALIWSLLAGQTYTVPCPLIYHWFHIFTDTCTLYPDIPFHPFRSMLHSDFHLDLLQPRGPLWILGIITSGEAIWERTLFESLSTNAIFCFERFGS